MLLFESDLKAQALVMLLNVAYKFIDYLLSKWLRQFIKIEKKCKFAWISLHKSSGGRMSLSFFNFLISSKTKS